MNNLGNMEFTKKNFEKARQLYEESLTYGDLDSWGTLINLGSLARIRGDWERSREYYLRAREVGELLGSETVVSSANSWLATLELTLRNLEEARKGFESGFNATWIRTNPLYRGIADGFLAYTDLLMGNKKDVRQRFKQALEATAEFLNQTPNIPSPWLVLEGQARLDVMDGHMQRAAQLFGASWTQREVDDWPLAETERPDYEACNNTIRSVLGDDAYHIAFENGKAMALKDAVAFALEGKHA